MVVGWQVFSKKWYGARRGTPQHDLNPQSQALSLEILFPEFNEFPNDSYTQMLCGYFQARLG